MVVLFGAIMALPLARWFHEIEPVPVPDAVGLGFVALAWALVISVLRRAGIGDRLDHVAERLTASLAGERGERDQV